MPPHPLPTGHLLSAVILSTPNQVLHDILWGAEENSLRNTTVCHKWQGCDLDSLHLLFSNSCASCCQFPKSAWHNLAPPNARPQQVSKYHLMDPLLSGEASVESRQGNLFSLHISHTQFDVLNRSKSNG